MTETIVKQEDSAKYWDYLLAADQSPRTFLLVLAPVLLAFIIVTVILIMRRYRSKQEAQWLSPDQIPSDSVKTEQKGDDVGS